MASNSELPENLSLSKTQFKKLLADSAKYKLRSDDTYKQDHRPELVRRLGIQSQSKQTKPQGDPNSESIDPATKSDVNTEIATDENANPKIDMVLIGSSQIERLAPSNESSPVANPITTVLIGDSMIQRFLLDKSKGGAHTRIAQLPNTFNAGCGGDKIENVLYRLSIGLIDLLSRASPKLWLLAIGTNNLRAPKGALRDFEVRKCRLLLQALLRMGASECRVIVCGIFKRRDVEDAAVERSNEMLKGVVESMNQNLGGERLMWVEPTGEIEMSHLADHVHFTPEGYTIWDEVLYPIVQEMLTGMNRERE